MENLIEDELKPSFIDRIDLQEALKIAIAGGLGWVIGLWFAEVTDRPDHLVSGMWCTMAAIVVLQANLGGTYKAAMVRFFGIVLGSFLGGMFTTFLGSNPISLSLSILCTVVICSILKLQDSVRMASMSVSVVMILWGLDRSVSPWLFAFYRAVDSTLGIIIAVTVAHLLWPSQAVGKLRLTLAHIFQYVHRFFEIITRRVTNLLDPEISCLYLKNQISDDLEKVEVYLKEAGMEVLTRPGSIEDWTFLFERTRRLRRLVISMKEDYYTAEKMIDTLLAEQLALMMGQIDQALQALPLLIQGNETGYEIHHLLDAQTHLNADLVRFRATHALRKWETPEVESFFVFFHSCDSLVDTFEQMIATIRRINISTVTL